MSNLDDDTDVLFAELKAWAKKRKVGILLAVEEGHADGDVLFHSDTDETHEILPLLAASLVELAENTGGTVTHREGLN